MKNFKTLVVVLGTAMMLTSSGIANANGIGYIDYKKIQENYTEAKEAIKTVDAKALELQQYLVDKEKQFKTLDSPVKKQNFEAKTAKEFKAKQDAYLKLKLQKEEAVYDKIQAATKKVLVEQKLDAVLDYRVIFVGGIDVTELVLQKLNASSK
ncbi:MAG: OmpH family outer membrane protein [bacterium]|nr:OmpH family outer membrane protein [bacterium]